MPIDKHLLDYITLYIYVGQEKEFDLLFVCLLLNFRKKRSKT